MLHVSFLIAAIFAAAPVAQAQTVTSHRDGEAVIVEAFEDVEATPEQAWAVLTDYEGLTRFIPDMTESRIIARSGNTILVDQKGSARLFLLSRPVHVRLEIVEAPYELVTSRAVSGSFKEMEGRYELKPQGGGMVRFTYKGRIVPDFWVPAFIETAAVRLAITRQFGAMMKEIRRRVDEAAP